MRDEGHEWTNGRIAKLENRIREVYREAGKEADRKLREFLRKFEVKDAILKKRLEDGKITEADYRDWLRGQVFQGERWKAQVRDLAETYSRANEIAMSMVNDSAPEVFAYNADWAAFEIERAGNADMGFGLYDADTVRMLLRDEPELLPPSKVDIPKDLQWNSKKIAGQITQGIILGEKLDTVAKRLRRVTGMNENSSLTHARTAMTGAQNAGRIETYHRAEDMGIRMRKEWLAALDSHTRETHSKLDGQKANVDEPFRVDGYEIMYPGDPAAAPEMVYNCRCTLIADLIDYPAQDAKRRVGSVGSPTIRDMTFAQWAGWKRQGEEAKAAAGGLKGDDGYGIMSASGTCGGGGVSVFAKINRSKFVVIETNITTDEVVITDERIQHINERHPGDWERYGKYLKVSVEDPDLIVRDNNPSTAVCLRRVETDEGEKYMRTTLRIHTERDEAGKQNSVLTYQKINKKEYGRLSRNKNVVYKRE